MIPRYRRYTFLPRGGGFHFAEPAPPLLDDACLDADDPEDVASAALARAQRGDFSAVGRVVERMETSDDGSFWVDCAALLAHAAPSSVLRALHLRHHAAQGPIREWVAEILLTSGLLWSVPAALRMYLDAGAKERLFSTPGNLSMLLETTPGAIFEGPKLLPRDEDDPPWYDPPPRYALADYEALVLDRHRALSASHGQEVAFFEGDALALPAIAQRAWARVHRGEDVEEVARARMVLEAATGRSLAAMYDDGLLRRDRALAALEHLIEKGELERYDPGVRYFFGHRIPD